jgi:hypothetical protein
MGAMTQESLVTPSAPKTDHDPPATQQGACGHWPRRRPGVVSPAPACRDPQGIREPSGRQAPDGGQAGGTPPTERRRRTRRRFRAPPLPMHDGQKTACRPKTVAADS